MPKPLSNVGLAAASHATVSLAAIPETQARPNSAATSLSTSKSTGELMLTARGAGGEALPPLRLALNKNMLAIKRPSSEAALSQVKEDSLQLTSPMKMPKFTLRG